MRLNNAVSAFVESLKSSEDFDDIRVINAYHFEIKPTQLSNIVVAVSLGNVDANSCGVGCNQAFGDYSINADIYIPRKMGATSLAQVVEKILKTQIGYEAIGVKLDDLSSDSTTDCYWARCTFTFNDLLDFGGVDNE
jgi:hypothetical protein